MKTYSTNEGLNRLNQMVIRLDFMGARIESAAVAAGGPARLLLAEHAHWPNAGVFCFRGHLRKLQVRKYASVKHLKQKEDVLY